MGEQDVGHPCLSAVHNNHVPRARSRKFQVPLYIAARRRWSATFDPEAVNMNAGPRFLRLRSGGPTRGYMDLMSPRGQTTRYLTNYLRHSCDCGVVISGNVQN